MLRRPGLWPQLDEICMSLLRDVRHQADLHSTSELLSNAYTCEYEGKLELLHNI